MLWTIFLVLVVLWMLGVVSSYTLGGFIHVLLVLAGVSSVPVEADYAFEVNHECILW